MKFWDNKGNIAIMAALTMPVIVGGAGLGVETGYWYYEQLHLQQAADAAAYAAALEHHEGNEAAMLPSATDAAQDNGFADASDDIAMTWPSAAHPADERSVDVALTRQIPRGFTALFGKDPITVRAMATAKYDPASSACMLALGKSAPKGIEFQGSSTVSVSGCVISSNSMSSTSIYSQGSSSVTAPCLTAVGGISINAKATMTGCEKPLANQLPVADPYQNLEIPTAGVCANGNFQPGKTYCGNQNLNSNINFAPGTYIFSGGRIKVNGGATITGQGVTLIFVNGAYLEFNGNSTVNLTAPATGPYAGMVMMGSRTPSGHPITLNGTSTSHLTGTIYFPADDVRYTGNFQGLNGCTQVVAKTIAWNGNSTVKVDCSAYGMGEIKVGGRPYLIG